MAAKKNFEERIGEKFGRLTIIGVSDRPNNKYQYMMCECECGTIKEIQYGHLKNDHVVSCGCYNSEKGSKQCINRNKLHAKEYTQKMIEKDCVDGTRLSSLTQKIPKNNKSGVKGVMWDKRRCRWLAYINFKGKHIFLGYYDNRNDAIEIRKIAEKKYFGSVLTKKEGD